MPRRSDLRTSVPLLGLAALACGPGQPGALEGFGDEEGELAEGESATPTDEAETNADQLELVSASLSEPSVLVLSFSEPLAPVDDVDPADFRVSAGLSYLLGDYTNPDYASSNYVDPNYLAYIYDSYSASSFRAVAIVNGFDANQLALAFDYPLNPSSCDHLVSWQSGAWPEETRVAKLLPHYSPGAIPVRSEDGDELAGFGADWVEWEGTILAEPGFGFPNLDPQVEIPCWL